MRAGLLTHNVQFYQRALLAEQALASLREALDVEVLVVDNGSTDGTTQWVRSQPQHLIYRPSDNDTSPGRGVGQLLSVLSHEVDDDEVLVISDDDMLWRPAAGGILNRFWRAAPDNMGVLCAYLEPVWPWNQPLGVVEYGGVRVLCRRSAPAAAWTMRASTARKMLPIDSGWKFDVAACRKLIEAGYLVAQVDAAVHQGWEHSTHDNRAIDFAQPLDRKHWGV